MTGGAGPVRDTAARLAGMSPVLSPERYVFVTTQDESLAASALATMREAEGLSLVLEAGRAAELGREGGAAMRLITLQVHSALDGVGLTAAVAGALAARDIPCNMIAGFHHDHFFVPEARAEEALSALRACQAAARKG